MNAASAPVPETLGEFAVEHELGRGGSGVVYAARRGGQEVALKVLRLDETPTAKERERFLAEARNLARVQHPGVVRVLAVGELADGRPYLAMERLRGSSLAEKLLMQRLPLEQSLVLFEQLVAAVGALHAVGLVHRDIKPENIMLVDGGERVVLLDFGIARGVDDLPSTTTQAGLQRGTPAYMAPERFFGARATVSSDVYETAMVLYVMLTGDLPWKDPRNPRERLSPRPPSAIGVNLSAGLEAALMTALGAEPVHRPRTVEELAASVRKAGWDGDTRMAPPVGTGPGHGQQVGSTAGRTQRVGVRSVAIAVGMAAVVAAAVAVAVIAMRDGETQERRAAAPAVAVDAGVVDAKAAASEVVVVPIEVADAGAAVPVAVVPVAPVRTTPVAVKAKPRAKKAAVPAPVITGTGSGTGTGTGTGTGSALPECRKITALYCNDEFRATEGGLANALCKAMTKNVDEWEHFPADARASQADWCRSSYDQMAAAVAERLRQFRDGIGPVKPQ